MDIRQKLVILGEAAKYDASCASSGSGRQGKDGFGKACMAGICHTWAADGRCISLLKVLLSNTCIYDCAYCVNRVSNDVPRARFTPRELADITVEFYRRNYIEGLFLSSAVMKNPDYTCEQMLEVLRILRNEYRYFGYIHVKLIPGSSQEMTDRIGLYADRVSVNVELPTRASLKLLAPSKQPEHILSSMDRIKQAKEQNAEERRHFKNAPLFAPAGQSTQMIVGATPDSDRKLLALSGALYKTYQMKRVYFSAYMPVGNALMLPGPERPVPLRREHRLYQADWLMRFYGFSTEEITEGTNDNLDLDLDPKSAWAIRHPEQFPVEVNTAPYETILRVPGIGVISAKRIIAARRLGAVRLEHLRKLGVVMKRAQYFVTAMGKFGGRAMPGNPMMREILTDSPSVQAQLSLFTDETALPEPEAFRRLRQAAGGELL